MALSEAAAAPIEVTFEGKVWIFSPIRFGALARIEQWMRSSLLASARQSCEDASEPERDFVMARAFENVAKISILANRKEDPEAAEFTARMLNSTGVIPEFLLQSLKKEHKDADRDLVERMLMDKDLRVDEILKRVMKASGLSKNPFEVKETKEASPPSPSAAVQ